MGRGGGDDERCTTEPRAGPRQAGTAGGRRARTDRGVPHGVLRPRSQSVGRGGWRNVRRRPRGSRDWREPCPGRDVPPQGHLWGTRRLGAHTADGARVQHCGRSRCPGFAGPALGCSAARPDRGVRRRSPAQSTRRTPVSRRRSHQRCSTSRCSADCATSWSRERHMAKAPPGCRMRSARHLRPTSSGAQARDRRRVRAGPAEDERPGVPAGDVRPARAVRAAGRFSSAASPPPRWMLSTRATGRLHNAGCCLPSRSEPSFRTRWPAGQRTACARPQPPGRDPCSGTRHRRSRSRAAGSPSPAGCPRGRSPAEGR